VASTLKHGVKKGLAGASRTLVMITVARHGMQRHVPDKSDDLLENSVFQQSVEKGIEDWGGNTDGDTIVQLLITKQESQVALKCRCMEEPILYYRAAG